MPARPEPGNGSAPGAGTGRYGLTAAQPVTPCPRCYQRALSRRYQPPGAPGGSLPLPAGRGRAERSGTGSGSPAVPPCSAVPSGTVPRAFRNGRRVRGPFRRNARNSRPERPAVTDNWPGTGTTGRPLRRPQQRLGHGSASSTATVSATTVLWPARRWRTSAGVGRDTAECGAWVLTGSTDVKGCHHNCEPHRDHGDRRGSPRRSGKHGGPDGQAQDRCRTHAALIRCAGPGVTVVAACARARITPAGAKVLQEHDVALLTVDGSKDAADEALLAEAQRLADDGCRRFVVASNDGRFARLADLGDLEIVIWAPQKPRKNYTAQSTAGQGDGLCSPGHSGFRSCRRCWPGGWSCCGGRQGRRR